MTSKGEWGLNPTWGFMYLFTQGEHVVSFSVERRKTQEHTLVADISISCPCPGFSPLITWASRCIKSSASPERALQLVCSREGWAVCLCLHPDSTAALHYYGEKCMEKKCMEKNVHTNPCNWSIEPGLEGWEGCCLVSSPLTQRRAVRATGKGRIFSAAVYF